MLKINAKLFWSVTISLAFLHLNLRAQVAKEITSKYPAAVVYRLYEVTYKAAIPLEKQHLLAEYFLKQDKLANKALTTGKKISDLYGYYTTNTAYLKALLSPLEFNDYEYNPDNTNDQIEKAIKFRGQLALSAKQVDDLLAAPKNVAARDGDQLASTDNVMVTEGKILTKILTKQQYDSFLELLVAPIAQAQKNACWAQLVQYGLVHDADSAKLNSENLKYFITAGIIDARINNSELRNKIDSVRGTYFAFKPLALWKLDLVNNTMPESQFATVIRDRSLLTLSKTQVDTLIAAAARLEQLRANYKIKITYKKYDALPFEAKNLLQTLTPLQYEAYLQNKNKTEAITYEKKIWTRLKQYGLDNGVDSARVNKELIQYELNLLVANERYHNSDTEENTQLKAVAENKKPAILKKLDLAVRSTTLNASSKKSLSW